MTDLTVKRINIQQEETAYKAGVSEATASRLGQSINFINKRQYDSHQFNFNGVYAELVDINQLDGVFPCLFDLEIVGITLYNGTSGTSGTTQLDIEWFNASNANQGSIFSTKPSLDFNSPDNAFLIQRTVDSQTLQNPTGATLPVLSKTDFSAGDVLRAKITSSMSGGEDAMLAIHFRPR